MFPTNKEDLGPSQTTLSLSPNISMLAPQLAFLVLASHNTMSGILTGSLLCRLHCIETSHSLNLDGFSSFANNYVKVWFGLNH